MKDGIHIILHNSGTFLQFPADLVTFTEETLNGKLHFLCSVYSSTLNQCIHEIARVARDYY